jgi:hypothetical protein
MDSFPILFVALTFMQKYEHGVERRLHNDGRTAVFVPPFF